MIYYFILFNGEVWSKMNIDSFMTPRLLAVAGMVKNSAAIADIGTDHAYIPVYLVTKRRAESAIAMDINEGPLTRADENIKRFNLSDKIKTRLSDGLEKLKNNEADTVVIAGMGGILINSIIESHKDRLTSVKKYILQPMTAIEETRKYLAENGFNIVDETLAKEDDKIYTVICAEPGKMKIENEINLLIGEALIKKHDRILPELLSGKIYEYEKAVSSMKNSKSCEIKEKQEHFAFLISELKKLQEECSKW